MAVHLFSIAVTNNSGTLNTYYYTSDKKWVTNDGSVVAASISSGLSVDLDKPSADGSYIVTVSEAAFGGTVNDKCKVTLTDESPLDRRSFKLALGNDIAEGERYGYGQTVSKTYNTNINRVQLKISGVSAGLLVSADGQSVSWEKDAKDTTLNITGIANTGSWSNAVWVDGKTVILGSSALNLQANANQISFYSNYGYNFSLSGTGVAAYTEAGWSMAKEGASRAEFYSANQTKGWTVNNNVITNLTNATQNNQLFYISGLSNVSDQAELEKYFNVDTTTKSGDAEVKITKAGVSTFLSDLSDGASRAIKLTDDYDGDSVGYRLGLSTGVNSDAKETVKGFTESGAYYNYSTSGNVVYSVLAPYTLNMGATGTTNLTMYSEKVSKTFSLSGLSAGHASSIDVQVSAYDTSTGKFNVTLNNDALADKDVWATGIYGESVSFVRGTSVADPTDNNSKASATWASDNKLFTYNAAEPGKGYDSFGTNHVVYHSASFGGEAFQITGLSGYTGGISLGSDGTLWANVTGGNSSSIGSITSYTNSAGSTTFTIKLNDSALSSIGKGTTLGISSTKGNFDYNLSIGDYQVGLSGAHLTWKDASLSYVAGASSFQFTDTYLDKHFRANSSTSAIKAGQSVTYSYVGAASHIGFTLYGISGASSMLGSAITGASYSSIFNYGSPSNSGGTSTYTITLKEDFIKALSNGTTSGVTLRIKDDDEKDNIHYLLANPGVYWSRKVVTGKTIPNVSEKASNYH